MKYWNLKLKNSLVALTLLVLLAACRSEYQKMEERELSSGKIKNELFLGLELGMSQNEFYEACWDMNKQGVLTNGPTELSVEHKVEMPSGNVSFMRFFPKFEEKKIYLMPVEYTYEGWAPWNEELDAEHLLKDVVSLYEDWYGPGFIKVSDRDQTKSAWVKVDGNRRIRIFKKHLSVVRAEFLDLNISKQLRDQKPS